MQFKFDPNQDFQLDAIQAVTDLFQGQVRIQAAPQFTLGPSIVSAVANRLDLPEAGLLANLHEVQHRNHITPDGTLKTLNGNGNGRFYNFSVEMETGTGKTYVYLRTALELFRQYGLRKYIIVVPSVAIREGVLKTLRITQAHFRGLYGNLPFSFYAYDSSNLSQIRQFALSDSVEFMIMTLASFNKDANVIRQNTDRLQGITPVQLVQAARPILILDEPQNMESENSIAALGSLNPLLALRYSATHRKPYNMVYRLTPYEAYRQGLVKRIEVASVVKEDDQAQPYLRLVKTQTQKKTITAQLVVRARARSGALSEKTLTVRLGDDLETKTNRGEYAGYVVEHIDPLVGSVRFANDIEIEIGQEIGADQEAVFEEQIRYTVREHLRKQKRLKEHNLKVLSLFFIDRVANYRDESGRPGVIRTIFDRVFAEEKALFPEWKERSAEEIQAAYFAQKKVKGAIQYKDSKTGESLDDKEAYDLIMKDKERLLSFEEPVSFIFSHSALREGWDNPNVFQICTLNQTASEVKKRQEIGRGIRLAVRQNGEREHSERLNILTVVANQNYERFVAALQSEVAFEYQEEIEARYGKPIRDLSVEERAQIAEEYGEGILPPRPTNARERVTVRRRKGFELKPEFRQLWEKIRQKTRYAVRVDTGRLIREVALELGQITVQPPRITISKAVVQVGDDENVFEALQVSAAQSVHSLAGRYPLPNLVALMSERMQQLNPPVRLTRRTLLEIIRRAPKNAQAAMLENPHAFAIEAVRIIHARLAAQLINGIQYEKLNEWYEMSQFEAEFESWAEYLIPSTKSPYDHVKFDSDVEQQFAADMERMEQVLSYIKLPSWFTIDTPIGSYNPDWAIVWQPRDEHGDPTGEPNLYLVRETKGTTDLNKLHPDEKGKILCGRQHFEDALGVNYKVVKDAGDLV